MKIRSRVLILLPLLAMGLLAACQPGSPAMEAAAAAAQGSTATSAESAAEPQLGAATDNGDQQALPESGAATGQDNRSEEGKTEGAANRCRPDKPHPQIGKLAAEFDVSETVIAGYLCEEGLSPGTIRQAYRLAEQSGERVDAVLALRADGLGWGQVRAELGLKAAND